jgi:hypothetical protein
MRNTQQSLFKKVYNMQSKDGDLSQTGWTLSSDFSAPNQSLASKSLFSLFLSLLQIHYFLLKKCLALLILKLKEESAKWSPILGIADCLWNFFVENVTKKKLVLHAIASGHFSICSTLHPKNLFIKWYYSICFKSSQWRRHRDTHL